LPTFIQAALKQPAISSAGHLLVTPKATTAFLSPGNLLVTPKATSIPISSAGHLLVTPKATSIPKPWISAGHAYEKLPTLSK
jgi:hypothetical protein